MKEKKRHNYPWTAREMDRMRRAAKRGDSARVTADALGRSTGAVKWKAMVEGVRFHAINQPRGAQVKATRTRRRNQRRRTS